MRAGFGRAVVAPVCAVALTVLVPVAAEAPTAPPPAAGPSVAEVAPAIAVTSPPPATEPPPSAVPPTQMPPAPAVATTGPEPVSPVPAPPVRVPGREGEPVWLQVPDLGISAPVDPMGVDTAGRLEVPGDPRRVGWWADGALLPDTPQVLVGHVDSRSVPGVFARLGRLAVGDRVTVTDGDGSGATWAVTALRQVPKDAFPTDHVYGPRPEPTLQLVTCTGRFDRATRHYRDNLIATAVRVS